ncbi:MAG: hypothetical protein ACTHJR_01030 [Sphingomonas sp.]|uniref:hypothetical protein n=1 Tax=Sphingomonas sp. TaxID=28214 RepID=UPI003F7F0F20
MLSDISEWATEFTLAIMMWNGAEMTGKRILIKMMGGGSASTAIVADMGNRSLNEGLETYAREQTDAVLRGHIAHFSKGFMTLLGYRNLYVHGLIGVAGPGLKAPVGKATGHIMQIKGGGRLRSMNRQIETAEIVEFKTNATDLFQYGVAIINYMGDELLTLPSMSDIIPPSLDKPIWPNPLQNAPSYHQV